MSTTIDTDATPQWAAIDSAGLNATSRMPVTTLTQDDFLSLLVAQMTNQDPLKPMEDMSSFMQIAQFSTLEQSKSMQQSMATIHANSMLGHTVQVNDGSGESFVGVVHQVLMIDGAPQIVVNGRRFTLDKVEAIGTPMDASGLPGTAAAQPGQSSQPALPDIGLPPVVSGLPELGAAPQLTPEALLGDVPLNAVAAVLGAAPR